MKRATLGASVFLVGSALWMGAMAALWEQHEPSRVSPAVPAPSVPVSRHGQSAPRVAVQGSAVAPAAAEATRAAELVKRLAQLLGSSAPADDDEIARTERELLELGPAALSPLLTFVRTDVDAARRNRLLDFLRRVPGPDTEEFFVAEASHGAPGQNRALAMDALAERRTDTALAALEGIAKYDELVLAQPFVVGPRDPADEGTELPDEVLFTPRMQAMSALASTRDPRAVPVLLDILQQERGEVLRMEAARNLEQLAAEPEVQSALRSAAKSDGSAYVRLAALHALKASLGAESRALLAELAARDPDAGVRRLAQQLQSQLVARPR